MRIFPCLFNCRTPFAKPFHADPCMVVLYDDFDCVSELNESFAKDGFWGRETFYGIVYAQKWILPLKGGSKRQTSAFSFVKVANQSTRRNLRMGKRARRKSL